MNREVYSGLPLYPVNGKVISQAGGVDKLRIQFMPVSTGTDDARSSAEGVTTADGSFYLIYMAPFEGAPAGKYEIIVYGKAGRSTGAAGGHIYCDGNGFRQERL